MRKERKATITFAVVPNGAQQAAPLQSRDLQMNGNIHDCATFAAVTNGAQHPDIVGTGAAPLQAEI